MAMVSEPGGSGGPDWCLEFQLEPSCVAVAPPRLTVAEHGSIEESMCQACKGNQPLFELMREEWEDFQEITPSPDYNTACLDAVCVILHVGMVSGHMTGVLAPLLDRLTPPMWEHYSTQVLPHLPSHQFEFASLVCRVAEVLMRTKRPHAVDVSTRHIARMYINKICDRLGPDASTTHSDIRIIAATGTRLASATQADEGRREGEGETIADQMGVTIAEMDTLCARLHMHPCSVKTYVFP